MQCFAAISIVCASLFGVADDPPNSEREENLYANYESYREEVDLKMSVKEEREVRILERTPAHIAEVRENRERAKAELAARIEAERLAAIAAAEAAERAKREAEEAAARQEQEEIDASQAEVTVTRDWVLPTSGYRITATFGASGSRWSNRHTGLDFAAPAGTPVVAIGNGEITFAGGDGPYGNKIEIRHGDGTVSWYCHLRAFERTSGTVASGEVIGYIGSTGNSTGPHLHLEVHVGGSATNPASFLRDKGLEP